jgi:hypothetical protein
MMRNHILPIVGAAAIIACCNLTSANAEETDAVPFDTAEVRFEQNATDGDVEAIFEVIGRKDGLTKLKIVAPNGHTIVDFNAPAGTNAGKKAATLGIRQFTFESPEPADVEGLKAAYPAGEYTFTAETAKGAKLESKAKLNHTLPATTSIMFPKRRAKDVATKNVLIKWSAVKDVEGYMLELEGGESNIKVKLPASATSFAVPDGFMVSGEDYQLGIGTISAAGNISYVEMEFTTADR